MSKKNKAIFSEEELREFYEGLPEISEHYLSKNMRQMTPQSFVTYILGVIHGREDVIETIVKPYIKRTEEILYGHH
jgi:hypothetical protein